MSVRFRSGMSRGVGSLLLVVSIAVLAAVAFGVDAGSAKMSRATACGGVPNLPPNDPNNLLPPLKLTKALQHDYTGWKQPIMKSQWSNWKPKGKAPYKVAIVWSAPSNSWNAYTFKLMQKWLKQSPLVDKNIIVTTASSQTAVGEQVQQYNAAVQQGQTSS